MLFDPALIALARSTATKHGLSDALVCAIVEQESSWVPTAKRYEPLFYQHYIVPLNLPPAEGTDRATSWGLMQTMLQSIVEIGYSGDGPSLFTPSNSLEWGCQLFVKKMARANQDAFIALGYWNGGGNPNYATSVINKIDHYITPITMDAGDF